MSGFQPVGGIAPVSPSPSIRTAARRLTGGDWSTGVAWRSTACIPSYLWSRCPDPAAEKEDAGTFSDVSTDAFTLYTPLACNWAPEDSRVADDAQALTEAHQAWGLARALWLGEGLPDEPTQPTLRRSAQLVNSGTAADLDDVVAVLLAHYQDCSGGEGGAVLHIPAVAIPAALEARLIWPEGDLYRGPLGAVVSPGPGYPWGESVAGVDGFGPQTDPGPPAEYAGNDSDEVWVYVTGPLEYAFGDVVVLPESEMERRGFGRRNTYEVWAEQPGIIRFDDCCVFGGLATAPQGPVS